jgi:membrane-anchored protein YejM (alkaline phosphatase superfamily)
MISTDDQSRSTTRHRSKWRWIGGVLLALAVSAGLVVWVWDWNWLRPLLEARLSSALERPITMERLEIRPGRVAVLTAYKARWCTDIPVVVGAHVFARRRL